jgi:hypothetical protein
MIVRPITNDVLGDILLYFQPTISPTDGVQIQFTRWSETMQGQEFQLGGEKPSRDSPPTFTCTKNLFRSPSFP